MPPRLKHVHVDIGLCPKCGAPGADYEYVIEGPIDETRETVRIIAKIKCNVCGYYEEKTIVFPVKALNLIKLLLVPSVRPVVEKLYLLYKIRIASSEGDST